jgi:hypothetical protein
MRHQKATMLFLNIILIGIFGLITTVSAVQSATTSPQPQQTNNNPPHYCPKTSDLTRDGLWWSDATSSWKCYTQSFTREVKTFIGAQWVGIKVGKIICLYQGTEDFSFPIALEQVHSELILEPMTPTWSAKVDGYKLCKSASVIDCPFFVEPLPDLSHIYEQIQYTGPKDNDSSDGTY